MHQNKHSKKQVLSTEPERKPSDWVEQAAPLNVENHHSKETKGNVGDETEYDSTSEEIISTHNTDSQQEGVDEEWSGDGAENRDFTADEDNELA